MSCNNLIPDVDVESIYSSCRFVDSVDMETMCENDDTKLAKIELREGIDSINKVPIQREYLRNVPLRGIANGSGKVVVNKLFVLKDTFRGKKISSRLHKEEVDIYKKNDFTEIQLDAAWNGITHWPKLGFELYKPEIFSPKLYTLWSTFFSKTSNLDFASKIAILTKYTSYERVPMKYKKGFGAWLLQNDNNTVFPMYKAIV